MLKAALLLAMLGFFPAGPNSGGADQARCLASCQASCDKSLTTCKQNAKSKTALESCQKSQSICRSTCLNKTCAKAK